MNQQNNANNLSEKAVSALPLLKTAIDEVKKSVIGKDEIIIKSLLAVLTGGHILLEDIPGVGKTTLATALSKVISLTFKRIQFTPDVMPSDVTGFNIFNRQTSAFEFREGAVFSNLLLADELNRTSGKTQSALLEAMEEHAVTIDGVTRPLPDPFIVIASQNPTGSVGTQLLPESQLDRFSIKLTLGYPAISDETAILKMKSGGEKPMPTSVITADNLEILQHTVKAVYTDDKIYAYISELVSKTRNTDKLRLGISTRGSLALSAMSKAVALLRGRMFVLPEDIKYIWFDVTSHRVIISQAAKLSGDTAKSILQDIINTTPIPKI
ncbi:MAG: MoxR family ATPase [Ruminococcus sp.]|jgi:MoxR-like ATPase|nr:MoxR family ATPase [Ruminococcus sp.]